MIPVTIDVPEILLARGAMTREEVEKDARLVLAARWFEVGRLSGGQAARMAGLSRSEFMFAISKLEISPFQETEADLDRALADA